jgi:hypothetical protein
MTRRSTYSVEMYAAIPYTVEVEAESQSAAMCLAEHEVPIPPEQMQLPALYVHALDCALIPRRRKG